MASRNGAFKMNKNLLKIKLLLIIVFALSIQSCSLFSSSPPQLDPKDKNVAMVFGHIDMEDAPSSLEWLWIKRFGAKKKSTKNDDDDNDEGYYATVDDGVFWNRGMTLGSYQIYSFGKTASFFSRTNYRYTFGATGRNQSARRLKKPGLYFMGSYKYKVIDSGSWFVPDKFTMVETKSPSEKELIKKILKTYQEDSDLKVYAHQISWMKKRLKELN